MLPLVVDHLYEAAAVVEFPVSDMDVVAQVNVAGTEMVIPKGRFLSSLTVVVAVATQPFVPVAVKV